MRHYDLAADLAVVIALANSHSFGCTSVTLMLTSGIDQARTCELTSFLASSKFWDDTLTASTRKRSVKVSLAEVIVFPTVVTNSCLGSTEKITCLVLCRSHSSERSDMIN